MKSHRIAGIAGGGVGQAVRPARPDPFSSGAVGHPAVPDHVSVWELILPIRQRFDQYVNLRPMKLLPGVRGPLAGRTAAAIAMVCVRENSEGEYAGSGGGGGPGPPPQASP